MLPDALSLATPCTRKKTFEVAAAANAHLIVQLKDNQPILRQLAEAVCATAKPLSSEKRVDQKRRNRHETRAVAVFDAKLAVDGTEWEPHVAAIIRIERTVLHFLPATGRWQPSREISFYLSSRPITAKTAAAAVRQHWSIETTSHYTRDVTFGEDASRIRKNPGVFARLRSFAYNILKRNQTNTTPQDRLAAAFGGLKSILAMTFSREH
jgi:predicted transposase YbfD/YdcC